MMVQPALQIDPKEYDQLDYLDKKRWISMWHQIDEVAKTQPKNVLEIGAGNGLVAFVLKKLYSITTIDLDPGVNPDVVGDVRKLPLKKNQFDTILCAQVLEHIPFEDFEGALKELYRVSKKSVIITLPHDYLTFLLLTIKIVPFVKPVTFFKLIGRNQSHKFNGQHYWEIGKRGYPLARIISKMEHVGFVVSKTYCLPENPYHRFFVLKKK